jgi:hypothetical protein
VDSVHGLWTTAVRLVHRGPALARTRRHRGEVVHSLKLGLWLLRGLEACRWGSGAERGGWRTHFDAHSGARASEVARRWQCNAGGDEAWWGRCSSPRERERRVRMGAVEDGRALPFYRARGGVGARRRPMGVEATAVMVLLKSGRY